MRVVITGASGNVGTAVIRALAEEPAVTEVVGLVRRLPSVELPKTRWVAGDVGDVDLGPVFRGAGAVIHLAWLIQPARTPRILWRANVLGSERVFDAAGAAAVPRLIYASSVGAYSPHPTSEPVDESWPVGGIRSNLYSLHKSLVERRLDRVEERYPAMRVSRLRPAFIFQRSAATGGRRLFLGPLVPSLSLIHI